MDLVKDYFQLKRRNFLINKYYEFLDIVNRSITFIVGNYILALFLGIHNNKY